ncbi:uncharacterized protein VICG_01478 [Vittaforma corneae ATCC 50505]|uniref:V-type proton ATPase subunit a n=1 Tax=Vittaforma corneae (strain ATCC 50505) TaxID=993615 RepID=L2GLH5_VITCO|nr:uncharacterized protein VICG_01478 [Vittaforma corneae ATCC 50505]ELA41494.1 hypothetical protein VICG_01478 [Vittaforma corneae ATCC 50505]
MLRSDEVECVSLYFGVDGIRNVLERLGESSTVHFIGEDNKNFKHESDRIEKFEQKLQYLKKELENQDRPVVECESYPETPLLEIESEINKYHERYLFLKLSKRSNQREEHILEQNLKMIKLSRHFISELKEPEDTTVINFDFITAISNIDKKLMIRQMLKHRLRRNVYIKTFDVELRSSVSQQTVFVVYVLAEDNKAFARSIIKNLGGRVLDFAMKDSQIHEDIQERYSRVKRLNLSIDKQILQVLGDMQKRHSIWRYCISKERSIVETMKKLTKIENTRCYVGEGWVLKKSMDKLEELKCFDNEKGRFLFEIKKSSLVRPTSFEPSEFSSPFQSLTNVFGVPKYQEINPAIFMTFTFPFLFGAMFGDVLHGLILLAISLFLIHNQKKLHKKCGVFQIILDGRYVALACAFFACGSDLCMEILGHCQ